MSDDKKQTSGKPREGRRPDNAAERSETEGALSHGLLGRAARAILGREDELKRKIDEIDRESTR